MLRHESPPEVNVSSTWFLDDRLPPCRPNRKERMYLPFGSLALVAELACSDAAAAWWVCS